MTEMVWLGVTIAAALVLILLAAREIMSGIDELRTAIADVQNAVAGVAARLRERPFDAELHQMATELESSVSALNAVAPAEEPTVTEEQAAPAEPSPTVSVTADDASSHAQPDLSEPPVSGFPSEAEPVNVDSAPVEGGDDTEETQGTEDEVTAAPADNSGEVTSEPLSEGVDVDGPWGANSAPQETPAAAPPEVNPAAPFDTAPTEEASSPPVDEGLASPSVEPAPEDGDTTPPTL